MSDRNAHIEGLLAEAGWSDAVRTPLAGDMSTRRYFRLARSQESAILMDADSSMEPFVRMTRWLQTLGLTVPNIHHAAQDDGLLLLEDFGDISVTDHIRSNPDGAKDIYAACVDLLLAIRAADPPKLPCPDAATLVDWTRLTDQYYPGILSQGLQRFRDVLEGLLEAALSEPPSVSLRDFHADNMMWLPQRHGILRFGLLDYQDAFLTHPVYDLVSLLTDARLSVPKPIRDSVITNYLDRSGDDPQQFRTAFAAFTAQRNLRILGIFAQGATRGKNQHLTKMPRVYGYFHDALNHPAFADIREEVLTALPPPETIE